MIIESYEYVIYTAMFLLPGYLINRIISLLVPSKGIDETDKVLRYLGYSLLNFTAWLWLFWLIKKNIETGRALYWLLLSFAVIITSLVTGIVLGVINNKVLLRKLFQKAGLQVEHPIPTAWDYIFSSPKHNRWTTVTLKSGKVLRGVYSNNSFASSDDNYRDLYLELSYIKDSADGDSWKLVDRTDGVWINPDEIAYIEFKE